MTSQVMIVRQSRIRQSSTQRADPAEKYAKALKRGQPNAQLIALRLYRDVVEDFDANANTLADALKSADIKRARS